MSDVKAEVKGLQELQRKMERIVRELHGSKALNGMRTATLVVQRAARINSPVDTGRLRASITPEVRSAGVQVLGVVGSVVKYAPYVERPGNVRGTGRRPYLKPALVENQDRIFKILDDAIGQIVREG